MERCNQDARRTHSGRMPKSAKEVHSVKSGEEGESRCGEKKFLSLKYHQTCCLFEGKKIVNFLCISRLS